jgi:hypothetical protein
MELLDADTDALQFLDGIGHEVLEIKQGAQPVGGPGVRRHRAVSGGAVSGGAEDRELAFQAHQVPVAGGLGLVLPAAQRAALAGFHHRQLLVMLVHRRPGQPGLRCEHRGRAEIRQQPHVPGRTAVPGRAGDEAVDAHDGEHRGQSHATGDGGLELRTRYGLGAQDPGVVDDRPREQPDAVPPQFIHPGGQLSHGGLRRPGRAGRRRRGTRRA